MPAFTAGESLLARMNLVPRAIFDAFPAVLFGRILVIACRRGIFEAIAGGAVTPGAVAQRVGFHPEAASLILQSLTETGYLQHSEDSYALAPQAKRWLLRSSPDYIGDFLAYIELLHKHWEYVESTLESGKPPSTYFETFSPREWRIYAGGMRSLARFLMPFVAGKIQVPDGGRILDIGGSHGLYAIEICRRNPNVSAVIADLPDMLRFTHEVIHEHNMTDRITTLPVDLRTGELPSRDFDTVLLFNIIHGFEEEFNRTLARRVAGTLTGGGTVYLLDQLSMTGEKHGAASFLPLMVGINLMNEAGGTIYTYRQVEQWYREAGFSRSRRLGVRVPGVHLVKIEK